MLGIKFFGNWNSNEQNMVLPINFFQHLISSLFVNINSPTMLQKICTLKWWVGGGALPVDLSTLEISCVFIANDTGNKTESVQRENLNNFEKWRSHTGFYQRVAVIMRGVSVEVRTNSTWSWLSVVNRRLRLYENTLCIQMFKNGHIRIIFRIFLIEI